MDKTLIFIDGENLWLRYKALKKAGRVPRNDTIEHADCFIWNPLIFGDNLWDIRRISYYTSVVGDEKKVKKAREIIGLVEYTVNVDSMPIMGNEKDAEKCIISPKTGQIMPFVRKKSSKSKKEGICDIAIAVDVMRACYRDHADTIWIFSGDGDFVKLFEEIVHSGKCAYASAFSSGLNDEIKYSVDEFYLLDDAFFLPIESVGATQGNDAQQFVEGQRP